MVKHAATSDRLGAFSDGVIAVIITIMVLELKPPEHPTFAALFPLWPTALSYLVSYLFVAIVWINHHHLLRYAEQATPRLIWGNFAFLFTVSLVPFSTAWIAETRLAAVPVFLYSSVFVLVNIAYQWFEREALRQAEGEEISARMFHATRARTFGTLALFVTATFLSLRYPLVGFGLVTFCVLLYLRPGTLACTHNDTGEIATQ